MQGEISRDPARSSAVVGLLFGAQLRALRIESAEHRRLHLGARGGASIRPNWQNYPTTSEIVSTGVYQRTILRTNDMAGVAFGRTFGISQITLGGRQMPDETTDHGSHRAVFKCSPELLEAIDRSAAASFTTRSNIIRDAVVDRLRKEGVIPELKVLG
jgi:hypothetical protein